MKRSYQLILTGMFIIGITQLAIAGEHGGKEHGGAAKTTVKYTKPVAAVVKTPSNADIKATMKSYVMDKQKSSGTFNVMDADTGAERKLTLTRVHTRVGKTGDYYYSCADFKDTESGELLDLDLDVKDSGGSLSVVDVRIHKVGGTARYTYDSKDNRVPLIAGTKSHLGAKGSVGQEHGGQKHETLKSSGSEHGGKTHKSEHGGKEHGG